MQKVRKLTPKQTERVFLDIWYEMSPELYEQLWYPDIEGGQLISDLVEVNPKLYREILDEMEERGAQEGFIF